MKIFSLLAVSGAYMFAATISLEIVNIQNRPGSVYVGLYKQSKNFKSFEDTYKNTTLFPHAKNITVTFDDITDGKYAIALFHDENENKKLDKNFFGIPKEGYAFSNNPTTLFEPSFDDISFELNTTTKLQLKVHY